MIENSQLASAQAVIELIEVDLSDIGGGTLYVSNEKTDVVFRGQVYVPLPIGLSGVGESSRGAPARPEFEIGLLDDLGVVRNSIIAHKRWRGARVVIKRCFADQLGIADGNSFKHGSYIIDSCVVDQKTAKFVLIGGVDFNRRFPLLFFNKKPNGVALTVGVR